MTNVLINLINKIKIAHKNKEHSITVRSSLLCVRVLRVLQQEGVILSFTLLSTQHKQDINVKYVKVFLKYFNGVRLFQILMLYPYLVPVNFILL
jgi:ribosomal protein S8